MRQIIFLSAILLFPFSKNLTAQTEIQLQKPSKKGSAFFYWGYNRSYFSKTNLHFTGPDYDFTLYDIKGSDRPTPFGKVYFDPTTFSIPQYNYRMGYFLTNRFSISLGNDHMKYIAEQDQSTLISGVITTAASEKYAGSYLNEPIKMTSDLLIFEHTDGFNLVTLDGEYLLPIAKLPRRFSILWNFGLGGIWVVTKTRVFVMGDGLDNDFHVAGFTLAAKSGPRIEFKNRFFLLAELKGGYASLPSVLIKNAAPEIGDHNLSFLEYYVAMGVNFRFKKAKK